MNRHIRNEQRLFHAARRCPRMMQHFFQCDTRGVLITKYNHPHRVAHENDVDAAFVEQSRSGIIVSRQRGDFLTPFFYLPKILHRPARKISRRFENASLLGKAVRRRPVLQKLSRNKIPLLKSFARSALECARVLASLFAPESCPLRDYQLSAKRITSPDFPSSLSDSLTVFFWPRKIRSGRISARG